MIWFNSDFVTHRSRSEPGVASDYVLPPASAECYTRVIDCFARIRLALGGVGGNGTDVCNIVAFF